MAGESGMAGKVALLLWAQTLSLAGAQTTQLLVDPPWTPAVLWDRVTLTCQGLGTSGDTTWYKDGQRWWKNDGLHQFHITEVGTYECHRPGTRRSSAVRVVNDEVVLQVPAWALLEGDRVTLRCRRSGGKPVRDVRFYRGEEEVRMSLHVEDMSLYPLRLSDSGVYSCKSWERCERSCMWVYSKPVTVTVNVHVPVANATITPGPPALQVRAGDPVTLRCSVQVGSAPVTFTWLRDGREVAQGPLLELRDIAVGHSGTYQCVATNQLDSVVSPELALEVTPRGHWGTAVAAEFGGSLLLLVLLLAVILGWRRWHRTAARKPQDTVPSAPPEDGEVLYTQVVSTARAEGPHHATSPQVTYAELPGPRRRQKDSCDIYENAL